MPNNFVVNRNNGRFGINKKHLKVKCVSCKDLLPLSMFVTRDLSILRKTENALCKACRTVCRNCGTPIIRSSGQRLQSRKEFLEKQLALNATVKSPSQIKSEERFKNRSNNLWTIDSQTGEEKRVLYSAADDDRHPQQPAHRIHDNDSNHQNTSSRSSVSSSSVTKSERDYAKSDDGMYCQTCSEREMIASTNVYYRFPMLKYKACPFPTDKYRGIIAEELAQHRGRSLPAAEAKSAEKIRKTLMDASSYPANEKGGLKKYGNDDENNAGVGEE